MYLYVTRHGKANPDSDTGLDEDRTLRARGERQAEFLGQKLKGREHAPEVIYSSGLVRAEQTADLIAKSLKAKREREAVLGLGHGAGDVIEVLELIHKRNPKASVMLVGHNPQLESLVSVLTEGPGGRPFRMRTGTCVILKIPTSKGAEFVGGAKLVDTLRCEE